MKLTRAPRLSTVMVSSTIIPSWAAAGQQALVWLEIRLPSPKTTSLPLRMRMGWTMCTCWPTTAVMAGELAGEGELEAAGPGDILIAPVNVDDDGLRAVGAGAVRVGQDLRGAGPVDRPRMRRGDAVGELGVGQEADADPLDRHDQRRCLRGGGGERAGVRHPGAIQRADRAVDP